MIKFYESEEEMRRANDVGARGGGIVSIFCNGAETKNVAQPNKSQPVDKIQQERARCIKAIRTTLANWRCVPSQATREFAELCIREIEK